ncbi:MAG: hypothetical protein ACE5O2_17675 [Armatimonadota bacterium]
MKLLTIKRLVVATVVAVAIGSAAGAVAPPPDTPLPLPDVIFYGTTTGDGGQLIQAGTVKAVLPRGIVSTSIGDIPGTDYSYSLAVPLSMYDPDNGVYEAGSAQLGEAVSFYIDDTLAYYRDDSGLTHNEFVIPNDAVGETYVLDLTIVGPDAYPLGDVNANGWRDSADALLVLKYDVGLIPGVVDFPPGPRTIYLPLCDIVQDGQCNSSDALRILQCDVRLPGVDCPDDNPITLTMSGLSSAGDATLVLRTEIVEGPEPDTITVRVIADDPLADLGAASLELRYDDALLAPQTCTENPDGWLDAAACNAEFGPGVARLSGAAIAGAGEGAVLAEITFRVLDPDRAVDDLVAALELAPDRVFDVEGQNLAWRAEGTPDTPPPAQRYRLYLPLIGIGGQ